MKFAVAASFESQLALRFSRLFPIGWTCLAERTWLSTGLTYLNTSDSGVSERKTYRKSHQTRLICLFRSKLLTKSLMHPKYSV